MQEIYIHLHTPQTRPKKLAIKSAITKNRKKPRIGKNSVWSRIGSATYCNQEILSLTHYPLSHASLKTDASHE